MPTNYALYGLMWCVALVVLIDLFDRWAKQVVLRRTNSVWVLFGLPAAVLTVVQLAVFMFWKSSKNPEVSHGLTALAETAFFAPGIVVSLGFIMFIAPSLERFCRKKIEWTPLLLAERKNREQMLENWARRLEVVGSATLFINVVVSAVLSRMTFYY